MQIKFTDFTFYIELCGMEEKKKKNNNNPLLVYPSYKIHQVWGLNKLNSPCELLKGKKVLPLTSLSTLTLPGCIFTEFRTYTSPC